MDPSVDEESLAELLVLMFATGKTNPERLASALIAASQDPTVATNMAGQIFSALTIETSTAMVWQFMSEYTALQFDAYTSSPAANATLNLVGDMSTRHALIAATEGSVQDPLGDPRTKTRGGSTLVSPGEYVLGDPCYALTDELWSQCFDFSDPSPVLIRILPSGDRVIALRTDHGDGRYTEVGSQQFYGVDSGLIGLVPMHVAAQKPGCLNELNRVVQFSRTTHCAVYDRYLKFGHVVIDTGWTNPLVKALMGG